jgi:hypothetical protein
MLPYWTGLDPAPRVSTSAQYGAMIGVAVERIGSGVNSDSGPSNVTLPLLFTHSDVYVVPKKLIGNGRATFGDDPSSFAASVVDWHPGLVITAFGPEAIAFDPMSASAQTTSANANIVFFISTPASRAASERRPSPPVGATLLLPAALDQGGEPGHWSSREERGPRPGPSPSAAST